MRPVRGVTVGGLLLGLALVWPGCGEGGSTAAGEAAAARPASAARADTAPGEAESRALARTCQGRLGGFLDVLDALRNQADVAASYEPYLDLVREARTIYADLPADRLPLACLTLVGAPAERALNEHIAAVNLWGDCLASPSCETASVEPELERRWEEASDLLVTASRNLRELRACAYDARRWSSAATPRRFCSPPG